MLFISKNLALISSLIFIILFNLNFVYSYKSKSLSKKCQICSELIKKFYQGLEKTEKGNFGGGNTAWEDKNLGNYQTSDIRFEEIFESTCTESDCHLLLEEQEENLLNWFKKNQKQSETELFSFLCINENKFCCPKETFGPNCKPCPKMFDLICSGNGSCEGEGSRDGSGKCKCMPGYAGDLCTECSIGYYLQTNNSKCAECYRSCAKCTGSLEGECTECKSGWLFDKESNVCKDINECLSSNTTCKNNEYCENTDGSYSCLQCDRACLGCSAKGEENCVECNKGYKREEDQMKCIDIDECLENPCDASKECLNKPGSFECRDLELNQNNETSIQNDLVVDSQKSEL